jgi:organic hydroperoxide reductase OsmC/OhrA
MHSFQVSARWKEGFHGEVEPSGVARGVPFAVPKEFGGPGGEWTPEHFLAASVSSCVMATFLSIAQASKLDVKSYGSTAVCSMEKGEGGYRITGVALDVRIAVGAEKDRDRAQRMLEKAEKLCPVSNAIQPGVTFQGTVEVATG